MVDIGQAKVVVLGTGGTIAGTASVAGDNVGYTAAQVTVRDLIAAIPGLPQALGGRQLVTEQVAITIYLADLYPEAGLAPGQGEPLRGAWLRWIAFYGSSFEPAMIDRALGRDGGRPSSGPEAVGYISLTRWTRPRGAFR